MKSSNTLATKYSVEGSNLVPVVTSATRRRFVQHTAYSAAAMALSNLQPQRVFAAEIQNAKRVNDTLVQVGTTLGTAPRSVRIDVSQEALDDLQLRLARTRWPDEIEGAGWAYGANREFMQKLAAYWQKGYDWRSQEAKLNEFAQFMLEIDGVDIHFLHVKGKGKNPAPLLLLHGWPDCFSLYLKIIPLLTDPASHGGKAEDAFTVVVPDIPGFGFSQKIMRSGGNSARMADLFAGLMTQLGYDKFLVHAEDFGASITERMALRHPDRLRAIHLTMIPPAHAKAALLNPPSKLEAIEQAYLSEVRAWGPKEGAYAAVQSNTPETLSFSLTDSPVGQLAWIVDKYYRWGDRSESQKIPFTPDELLTNVMIYWLTQTGGSSARLYYETERDTAVGEPSFVSTPSGFAIFARDITPSPKAFVQRFFNVQRWTELPHGGHFAALEEPSALAIQIREYFRSYRDTA